MLKLNHTLTLAHRAYRHTSWGKSSPSAIQSPGSPTEAKIRQETGMRGGLPRPRPTVIGIHALILYMYKYIYDVRLLASGFRANAHVLLASSAFLT